MYEEIRQRLIKANAENCKGPCFAPLSGHCYVCGKDIVTYYGDKYATTEITGCPYCCTTYCD